MQQPRPHREQDPEQQPRCTHLLQCEGGLERRRRHNAHDAGALPRWTAAVDVRQRVLEFLLRRVKGRCRFNALYAQIRMALAATLHATPAGSLACRCISADENAVQLLRRAAVMANALQEPLADRTVWGRPAFGRHRRPLSRVMLGLARHTPQPFLA